MEAIRETGACNMLDGPCVAKVATWLCTDEAVGVIDTTVAKRGAYGRLLKSFAEWREGLVGHGL